MEGGKSGTIIEDAMEAHANTDHKLCVCVTSAPHEKTRAHVGMEGQMQTADESRRRKHRVSILEPEVKI